LQTFPVLFLTPNPLTMTSIFIPSIGLAAGAVTTNNTSEPAAVHGRPLSILDMNNKAVVSLKQGRLPECMALLRDTLISTRTSLLQHQQQQAAAGQHDGVAQRRGSSGSNAMETEDAPKLPLLSLFSIPLFTHQQLIAPGDELSAHCPLFDRAIVLGSDSADHSAVSWMMDNHCKNVTLGVLLYNLALSHHLTGIYKGTSTDDFRVAINLYQMSLSLVESSIQRDIEEQDNQEECQNLVILLCAIFNNLANIHSRFFHVTEARNCIECLREIVSSVSSSDGVVSPCVEEDHFFFYLNLFVVAPVHDFAIAPAA
jgi:hypothetical protein